MNMLVSCLTPLLFVSRQAEALKADMTGKTDLTSCYCTHLSVLLHTPPVSVLLHTPPVSLLLLTPPVSVRPLCPADSQLGVAEVWTSRQALQDVYQKMLVTDLEYALDKKVEQDL